MKSAISEDTMRKYFSQAISGLFDNGPVNISRHHVLDIEFGLLWYSYITDN